MVVFERNSDMLLNGQPAVEKRINLMIFVWWKEKEMVDQSDLGSLGIWSILGIYTSLMHMLI